jgi:hypothetical protein
MKTALFFKDLAVVFLAINGILGMTACKEELVKIPDLKVGSRKVLIEELSGVNCSNCPDAAKEIEKIRASVGPENVIAVTIYPGGYGVLSRPVPASRYDFRFPEADGLVNYLGAALAIPALSVNRVRPNVADNTPFLITRTQWGGAVRNELAKEPAVGILLNVSCICINRQNCCTTTT